MSGPLSTDTSRARYSARPFPPYRFLPGRSPHPRRDPRGYAYGRPEPTRRAVPADRWFECEDYLYAVDLYNFAYWWECHEIFEALWHGAGHATMEGRFFRAVIQLAAANLKHSLGSREPARKLARSGLDRLGEFSGVYMGLDVSLLVEAIRASLDSPDATTPLIRLTMPADP